MRIHGLPAGVTYDSTGSRITLHGSDTEIGGLRSAGEFLYLDDITYNVDNQEWTRVAGDRQLVIDPSVPDGSYPITFTNKGGYVFSRTGTLKIESVPVITVEDINFGEVPFGPHNSGTATRSGRIELSHGKPNSAVTLYLSADRIGLKKLGKAEVIPVDLRINPPIASLDGSGGAVTNLEATADASPWVSRDLYRRSHSQRGV